MSTLFFSFKTLLRGRGGIKDVSKIAFPLVIASLGHAINLFTDRVMLANFSSDAMAAAFPAGLTSFTMSCFFLGIIGYAGVFVAQYTGANQMHNAAKTVWQACFLAIAGWIIMASTTFFAEDMFQCFGHDISLQKMETTYYNILSWGGFVHLMSAALFTFWSGRAKTNTIMTVNLIITSCNIPFNALLIFGFSFTLAGKVFSIAPMGIAGAAWGTISAGALGMLILLILFFRPANRKKYKTLQNPFSWDIMKRMIRFGTPNGVQLVLELATFNIFVVLLGKISVEVLAASTVAMSSYSLAFNPMIGFGQAASILVGQGIGAKNIRFCERSVRSCIFLLICYSILMIIVFVVFPELIFTMFDLQSEEVRELSRIMLMLTCFYLIFDAFNVLYGNAIKGAGDTRFAMWAGVILGWGAYAIPCIAAYILLSSESAIIKFGMEKANSLCVWTLWGLSELYIFLLGLIFWLRYKQGKWKKMSVID